VAFNKETKPETKDKPHPFEKRPKQDITRAIGKTALKGPQKDKPKK